MLGGGRDPRRDGGGIIREERSFEPFTFDESLANIKTQFHALPKKAYIEIFNLSLSKLYLVPSRLSVFGGSQRIGTNHAFDPGNEARGTDKLPSKKVNRGRELVVV